MTDKPMRTAVRKVRNCGYKPLKILTFDEAVHEPRVSDTTSKKEFVFIPDLKARLIQLLKKDKNIKKTITSPNTKHPIILNQEDFDELLLEIK